LEMSQLYCVITTIQQPTADVRALAKREDISRLVIIGDKKGPASFDLAGADFYDLSRQLSLPYQLASKLPTGAYARKNIGYLIAMAEGASRIYETDDDNAPMDGWSLRQETVQAIAMTSNGWVNAYRFFSNENIWPRGLPLNEIKSTDVSYDVSNQPLSTVRAPIQQGLANGSPDVDAVWRLVLDHEFTFQENSSIRLNPGAWCPFNSQSTWWWPEAYPLMYLPSFCSFRMTDIWRSFIAQRCLWELGHGIVFHAAEVFQQRNEHDLMRDFKEEIDGYLGNVELVAILEQLELRRGAAHVHENLLSCYSTLVDAGFFPQKELDLVKAWVKDVEVICAKS